ncbi:MAG: hypothetical protein EAZ24_16270, partial [Burkholderiales bacterium]
VLLLSTSNSFDRASQCPLELPSIVGVLILRRICLAWCGCLPSASRGKQIMDVMIIARPKLLQFVRLPVAFRGA